MNKQELIEGISHLPSDCSRPRPMIDKLTALELIKLLDEPQKVTVPQFVADWIEECKNDDFHLFGAMEEMSLHQKKLDYWFREDDNMELFARAWLDGYEVDKEPKYTVKFKATKQYLSNDEIGIYFDPSFRSNFRKSDLEKLGLTEVFNSPLFEVEEVTK
nr:MAG TPA: Protein of unknown function (DUF1642) [Caudoviricetes sp.]